MSTLRREVVNERIIKIGLESGMLNYVDNETPRHYFLSGHADEQDLAKFAELIVQECAKVILENPVKYNEIDALHRIRDSVKEHFGVTK